MKKVIIIILLIILLISGLLISGYFYLKETYVPKTLKTLIEDSVKNNTNLKIKIGSISYELLKGVIIKDLVLFKEEQEPLDGPLSTEEIRFNIMLLPSLKGKRIIIPTLYINKPRIRIERDDKGAWNIEHLLKKKETVPASELPLVLAKIKVISAELIVRDNTLSPALSRRLTNFNLDLNPSRIKNITFKLSADIVDNSSTTGRIFAQGKFNRISKTLTAHCEAKDIELAQFWPYLNLPKTKLKSLNLKNIKTDIDYAFSSETLSVSAEGLLHNFDIRSADLSLEGKAKFSLTSSIKSPFKNPQISSLSLAAQFSDSKISGLKILDSVEKIKAKISIKDNFLVLETLEGLWQQNKINANAKLSLSLNEEKAKEMPLSLDVYIDKLNTQKLIAFLPQDISQQIKQISGFLDVKMHVQGLFKQGKFERTKLNVDLDIKDIKLKLARLKEEIENIKGKVALSDDDLKLEDLTLSLYGQNLNINGVLENFKAPEIKINMSSPLFNARAHVLLRKDKLQIESLNINSLNSEAKVKGSVYFNKQPIEINLNTQIKLETSNIKTWLPQLEADLDKIAPEGNININAKVSGRLGNFPDLDLSLDAKSQSLKLNGLKLDNILIAYNQADNFIDKLAINCDFYGGYITLRGGGKISAGDMNVDMNIESEDIDLAMLRKDTPFSDKDVSGTLCAKLRLNAGQPLIESLIGKGEINIKDGNIWKLELLKGLGKILLLPEFSRINFREGNATFTVQNKRIYTDDLTLESPQMSLAAAGWLGFDGELNFDVYCEFSQKYIEHSNDLRKLLTSIFAEINKYLNIKISGNIKKPQYKILPTKLKIDILKTLKGILDFP